MLQKLSPWIALVAIILAGVAVYLSHSNSGTTDGISASVKALEGSSANYASEEALQALADSLRSDLSHKVNYEGIAWGLYDELPEDAGMYIERITIADTGSYSDTSRNPIANYSTSMALKVVLSGAKIGYKLTSVDTSNILAGGESDSVVGKLYNYNFEPVIGGDNSALAQARVHPSQIAKGKSTPAPAPKQANQQVAAKKARKSIF